MPLSLKAIYHAAVPKKIRYPIGHGRRALLDSVRRRRIGGPLPPRSLLQKVQMTPWIDEYLEVGSRSHRSILDAVGRHRNLKDSCAALDFGCGLSRTLRHFADGPSAHWHLHGCDVDPPLVEWSRSAFPHMDIRVNAVAPPLPWEDRSFDLVWAVSVFTHFDSAGQRVWADELARVIKPGGLAAITTMGPHAFGGFPNLQSPENQECLDKGFFFHRAGDTFNSNGAFHTEDGVRDVFGGGFEILEWTSGGLDGFQDLTVMRRPEST